MRKPITLTCLVALLAATSAIAESGSWFTATKPRADLLPEDIRYPELQPRYRLIGVAVGELQDRVDLYGGRRTPAPKGYSGPQLREGVRKRRFRVVEDELLALHSHGWLEAGRRNSMVARIYEVLDDRSLLPHLDAWVKASPGLFLPYLLRGLHNTSAAWDARGNGYAITLTPAQNKVFNERLEHAEVDLRKAHQLGAAVPLTWKAWIDMRRLRKVTNDKPEEIERDLSRAASLAPEDLDLAYSALERSMRKWGGSHDKMMKMADRFASPPAPPHLGRVLIDAVLEFSRERKDPEKFLTSPRTKARLDKMIARIDAAHPDWPDWKVSQAELAEAQNETTRAAEFYRQAAELGHRASRRRLVPQYVAGGAVSRAVATEWIKEGARAGFVEEGASLARLYANGIGVDKNEDAAIRWFEWAASRGDTDSMLHLAEAFETGLVTRPNPAGRSLWLKVAADRWNPTAMTAYGLELLGRTPDGADAPEALRLFYLACALGHRPAFSVLDELVARYQSEEAPEGLDPESYTQSRAILAEAYFVIGRLLWFSMNKWQDKSGIGLVMRQAVDLGYPEAAVHLGDWYRTGSEIEVDLEKMLSWYKVGADAGLARGQNAYGWALVTGTGTKRDTREALAWFVKAADQGQLAAQARAARMFEGGMGVPRDVSKARHYYQLARQNGSGRDVEKALRGGLKAQPSAWPSWAGKRP